MQEAQCGGHFRRGLRSSCVPVFYLHPHGSVLLALIVSFDDDARFNTAATLPGMYERTVTIGSAGKTFSVTGWKLGWSIGPHHLIKALCFVHQNCNFTCPTPLQVSFVNTGFLYLMSIRSLFCNLLNIFHESFNKISLY